MKKRMFLGVLFIGLLFSLCGCQREYYGKGIPFQMSTSSFPGYYNQEIGNLSADNYQRFMHASYLLIVDKFGVENKIKISPNIPRHNWDFSNIDNSGLLKNYVEADGSKKKVGIDVSEHQGVIDWPTVSQYVDFAFVRVGYRGYANGNIVGDPYFFSNVAGASENGIDVGVYFYSQAITYEEGVEEAQFVLSQIGDRELTYPIVLDREDPMQDDARTNNLSMRQHTDAALGFLETIEAAGKPVMIYTNRIYFALYLDTEAVYKYPVWYAQYADEPDWPYEFAIWQYTESGQIPGIYGSVDMNLQMLPIE